MYTVISEPSLDGGNQETVGRYTLTIKSNSTRSILSTCDNTGFRQSRPSWACSSLATMSTATSCRLCRQFERTSDIVETMSLWINFVIRQLSKSNERASVDFRQKSDETATKETSKVDEVEFDSYDYRCAVVAVLRHHRLIEDHMRLQGCVQCSPPTTEEVNAIAGVCLSVCAYIVLTLCGLACLSVSKITQKRVDGFGWNVACRRMSKHGRTD